MRLVSRIILALTMGLLLAAGPPPVPTENGGRIDFGFYVPDQGAVCNGSNDDTAKIQAAINAASARNGTVSFPAGKTCKISSTLTVTVSGVKLVCKGGPGVGTAAQCSLLWAGGASPMLSFAATVSATGIYYNGVSNMTLDGNGAATIGIYINGAQQGTLENVHLRNMTTWGLQSDSNGPLLLNTQGWIVNNLFVDVPTANMGGVDLKCSDNSALQVFCSAFWTFTNPQITYGSAGTNPGMLFDGGSNNNIIGGRIFGTAGNAIDLSKYVGPFGGSQSAIGNIITNTFTQKPLISRGTTTFPTCRPYAGTGNIVGITCPFNNFFRLNTFSGGVDPVIEPGSQLNWQSNILNRTTQQTFMGDTQYPGLIVSNQQSAFGQCLDDALAAGATTPSWMCTTGSHPVLTTWDAGPNQDMWNWLTSGAGGARNLLLNHVLGTGTIDIASVEAASGNTPRLLSAHLGDAINIKDLGATGNGTADDSPAFAAAMALTGSRVIYLPCGTYQLSSQVSFVVVTSLSLRGAARECVTIKTAASTALAAPMFNFATPSTLKSIVSDITFDASNITSVSGGTQSILHSNLHRLDVRRIAITGLSLNANIYGVAENGQSSGFAVEDSIFSFTTRPSGTAVGCLFAGPSLTTASTNGTISGNQFSNCSVYVEAMTTTISHNTFQTMGLQGAGLFVAGTIYSSDLVVDGNILQGVGAASGLNEDGMFIGAPRTTITNNRVSGAGRAGITDASSNSIVTGNTVYDNGANSSAGGVGIVMGWSDATFNSSGSFVAGNTAYDSGVGVQNIGISDQIDSSGLGCNDVQICAPVIGDNHLSAPTAPIVVRSANTTYSFTGAVLQGGASGGSANAQTLASTNPSIITSTLIPGLTLTFTPTASNTGAMTLTAQTGIANTTADAYNVNPRTTGALAVKKKSGASLVDLDANDVTLNIPATVVYDGTEWVLRP
jgi:parallel beta-helix repeat protein